MAAIVASVLATAPTAVKAATSIFAKSVLKSRWDDMKSDEISRVRVDLSLKLTPTRLGPFQAVSSFNCISAGHLVRWKASEDSKCEPTRS